MSKFLQIGEPSVKPSRRDFLNLSSAVAGVSALNWLALPASAQNAEADRSHWPQGRALPRFPKPQHLDVADITSLSGDEQAVLVTLQGIVNKKQPRIYWLIDTDGTDKTWLNTLQIPTTTVSGPWSLLEQYRTEINGAVIYDPNVPDTVNVATSLASLNNAVIASAALAKQYNLPVVDDLTGRFQNKFDAYDWALSNLWPKLTHRILTAIGPTNTVTVPGVQWTTLLHETRPIHDSSNKQVYTADLSSFAGSQSVYLRYQDAVSSDGWGPSVSQVTITADGNTIASFQPGTSAETPFLFDADSSQLASGWRFADGGNYFIYKFAVPAGTKQLTLSTEMWNEFLVTATNTAPTEQTANPLFRDYIVATQALVFWLDPLVAEEAALFSQILQKVQPDTPYLGWFPHGNETQGVTLCAQNGVLVGAADVFNNGTVFGGARDHIRVSQPEAPSIALENKVYVVLTMSEGDNLQYVQHRMRSIWDDPNRGQAPITWSISPLLLDAAPSMLGYYQRTQTANDFLVAGPSGAGYTYPGDWPANALPRFTKRTGDYMRRSGMNIIYALNRQDNTDIPLSNAVAAQYVQDVNPLGILYNWESTSQLSMPAGLPTFTQIGISSVAEGTAALQTATANWDGKSPLFVALGVLAWNLMPSDVNTLVASFSSQYQAVRADVFFRLLKQSLNPQH